MLKNIIALAIVAIFAGTAYAQAPVATPLKAIEVVKSEAKMEVPKADVNAAAHIKDVKKAAKPTVGEKTAEITVEKSVNTEKIDAVTAVAVPVTKK
jgi:hypothetical protein